MKIEFFYPSSWSTSCITTINDDDEIRFKLKFILEISWFDFSLFFSFYVDFFRRRRRRRHRCCLIYLFKVWIASFFFMLEQQQRKQNPLKCQRPSSSSSKSLETEIIFRQTERRGREKWKKLEIQNEKKSENEKKHPKMIKKKQLWYYDG